MTSYIMNILKLFVFWKICWRRP